MGHTVKNEYIDSFTIYGLSVCLVISLSILNTLVVHKHQPSITVPSIEQHPKKIVFDPHVFENIQLQARAYVIYDLTNHKIIAGNHETVMLPLASITKVMTAVSSTIHKSKEDSIVITPISIEGDYDIGLKNHQVWKLVELLKYTLVFSSNDGAESVADSFGGRDFFVRQMNIDAKNLGLNFIFTDPAGRDVDGKVGGRGSAVDVARLLEIARKNIPEILDATTKKRQTVTSSSGRVRGIPNTNQTVQMFPGIEASKTGYTDLAGGNLAVIIDATLGHPVAIVVLGSTKEGRFEDVQILYKTLLASIRMVK